jgi:hypothetical protein
MRIVIQASRATATKMAVISAPMILAIAGVPRPVSFERVRNEDARGQSHARPRFVEWTWFPVTLEWGGMPG